jgi:hypothetical protein
MKITKETLKILAPLSDHRSQVLDKPKTAEETRIGDGWSADASTPTISHAEFVATIILPALQATCTRFGQETVASEIVELTLPIYKLEKKCGNLQAPSDEAAAFLSCTLRGGDEQGNISDNVRSPILAEKYGIKDVFGPISELGIVHQKTRVFCPTKFFHHHACRMGEVIDNFSQADYHAYIKVCKNLLQHGVYDWSIENSPEKWGMLRPSIRLYGMSAVLTPMAQAMIDIAHLPGTKETKYRYSLMARTIRGLYPIMIPKVRTNGVSEINKMLQPIVDFVLEASRNGAFKADDAYYGSIEGKFFTALVNDYFNSIKGKGIQQTLTEIRPYWFDKLSRKDSDQEGPELIQE